MSYPQAIDLPFNSEIIKSRFTQTKPGQITDNGNGYWLLIQGDSLLLADGALHHGSAPEGLSSDSGALIFGEWDGEPVRAVAISREAAAPQGLSAVPWTELPDDLLTLYGVARQVLYWEKISSCCSKCGGSMTRIPGTWGKSCDGCGHQHFPHIHPCIIVLVRRGEEFLLARKPEWAPGRYSLVAGFVDFGESLEECVVREVMEETGLTVENIRYVGSQNWPFPSQLMAGFVADYASGEIVIDGEELEDAGWFSRDRMPPALPPSRSIARWIIDRFALGTKDSVRNGGGAGAIESAQGA